MSGLGKRRQGAGECFQCLAGEAIVGAVVVDDGPEAVAVIHFAQMGEFVHDHVIDDVLGKMDQTPVQPDSCFQAATSPARARRGQRKSRCGDPEARGVVRQTQGE